MAWVIDCSFAAALFLPDERSNRVAALFRGERGNDEFIVPLLWWYELSNILKTSVTRKRLTHADVMEILKQIKSMGFATDSDSGPDYARNLFDISVLYGLSAYDAAYLCLAMENKASLATLDNELAAAAMKAGVKTYPGR
jgi:predicted nucleic acid-binding protein